LKDQPSAAGWQMASNKEQLLSNNENARVSVEEPEEPALL